ncbi:hypothetical protein [Novosphingobium sp.]|uniref:hypothetical protein n=1 Tax=Novosphingobium sp. TaxID=1874826 RepID=UPI0035B4E404
MAGFLFALLACVVAGIGARDQLIVAGLSARQGRRVTALVVALASAAGTAWVASWAAREMGLRVDAPTRQMLAALVLGIAALEMLLIRPGRVPEEPTDSLGAFALVLFAQQLTDATRFLLFAIAAASGTPGAAGLGGAIGGAVVVLAGWIGGEDLLTLRLTGIRRVLGLVLLAIALWLGLGMR